MKNKIFSFITTVVMLCAFVGVIPTMEVGAYSSSQAIDYARKYWNNYNPAYTNYNSVGGDCANFVSQCLYAGGLPQDGTWKPGSAAWINCASQINYFRSMGYEVKDYATASDIKPGNPVYYYNGNTMAHTAICVGYSSNGTPLVAAHNKNHWEYEWTLGGSNYWGGSTRRVTIYMPGDDRKRIDTPIDNSYSVPWSGQPKATSGLITVYNVYGDPYPTSVHNIAYNDNCTVHEVYGSGFCKVEYPVSGGTHTEYAKTSDFDVPIKPLINSPSYSSIAITNGHWFFNTNETINFSANSDTATVYWIGIDRDGQRVVTEQMPNGEFSISFAESGNYSAYVTAANDAGYLDSERVEFKVFSPADLGDEKIVYIENIATGLRLSVDGNVTGTENVYCSEKDNTKKQYWKLQKQSDGYYKVVLINDGRCLEVFSGGTENGTNISVYSENSEFIKQKFYFYKINDAYYIKPIFSDLFLDMDMSTYNVATWGYGEDWAPQKFQIYELDKAGESKLSATAGTSYTDTQFSWTQSSDTNRYVVKIWKDKAWEGSAYKEFETTGTSWNVTLPAGTYQAYVDSCNNYSYICSNVVTFTVEKGTPPSIKGDVNSDSSVGISDVVLLQKWLVKKCDLTDLINWQAADMNSDGQVNVFDVVILKRRILKG